METERARGKGSGDVRWYWRVMMRPYGVYWELTRVHKQVDGLQLLVRPHHRIVISSSISVGTDGVADRLIYLWNEAGDLLMRFKGSPEPVRSLCCLSDGSGFASACNDGYVLYPSSRVEEADDWVGW